MNPYFILGINSTCSDEDVRCAYLEKVKSFIPDKFPEHFKRIHQAFEKINTQEKRCSFFIDVNSMEGGSIDDILIDYIKSDTSRKPLGVNEFQKLIEETSFL